jgi:hypothetical protein
MAQQESAHRCEVCGTGGTLVQFGDQGAYRYHCLNCWWQVAEQVVVEYVERTEPPTGARRSSG